jgi:3-phytase
MLLRFDEASRRIVPEPITQFVTGLKRGGVGICLYQSKDGSIHVGAAGSGAFRQWRLEKNVDGSIRAVPVRELKLKTSAEGCVFDDTLRRLYISEEKLGLWRLAAEPEDGDVMELIDSVKPNGGLADIEGVAVYARDDGTGYLIASSQGDSSFRVYRREGDNELVGSFRVDDCPSGPVMRTTGIEVTSASLGAEWPAGMLVVQDNETKPQNFKYVAWDQIEKRLR